MVVGFMGASPFVQGLVFALLGVGFWVGGLLGANYLWKRWRNED
ncbi:hypothetical protein [Natronomonas halophila]|nr:hypothetical protein [Natronomonas halophila]